MPVTPPPQRTSTALVRRLIRDHIRPHMWQLVLASLFMAVEAATTAGNAWLLQPAVDGVLVARDSHWLMVVPLAIVAVTVVKAFASYFEGTLMSGAGQEIVAEAQVRMYGHLIRADLAWLHQIHSAKLVSTFLYDATLLRDAVSRALTGMVKDSLSLVFLAGVMFYQNWALALVAWIGFPIVALLSRKMGKRARKGSSRGQEETGKLASILAETFDGARLVKAYGMEARETERTKTSIDVRVKHIMKVIRARSATSPIVEAMGGVSIAAAIYFAAISDLSPGTLMSFLGALMMAYQPLKSIATLNTSLQEGLAAADRLFDILDVEPTIKDVPGAVPLASHSADIRFEQVGFSYEGGTEALRTVDLVIPAGKKVALVGASGAGKSTIMNLIPRFYDATDGRVLVGGQDVKQVTLASLRRQIALVSQELTLFDDTVRANILYGKPEATEAEIVSAATDAAAHEFIVKLPKGYDTQVGENGVKLSGGQRQRIAIARAMVRNAPILLLDEATSALDAEAERKVQQALKRLMQGRTTLVIAHRLSTVRDADEIYVMEAGQVVESGRHAELLARGGTYASLYATQFAQDENGGLPPVPAVAAVSA